VRRQHQDLDALRDEIFTLRQLPAGVVVGQDIEGAVRPLPHVADALVQFGEQPAFFAR